MLKAPNTLYSHEEFENYSIIIAHLATNSSPQKSSSIYLTDIIGLLIAYISINSELAKLFCARIIYEVSNWRKMPEFQHLVISIIL